MLTLMSTGVITGSSFWLVAQDLICSRQEPSIVHAKLGDDRHCSFPLKEHNGSLIKRCEDPIC